MITTTVMTPAADAAAQRYGQLIEGWRLIFRDVIGATNFGTERGFARASEQAYAMARSYLEGERREIAETLDQIAREGHTDATRQIGSDAASELAAPASELVTQTDDYLARELSIQIERDVAFLVRSLRQAALQINLVARSQRIPFAAAQLQYRAGDVSELRFFFRDRSNARWPSRKFVRAVWRQALVTIYNETVLLTLADHGIEKARVRHINPGAATHGMVIAMSSNSSDPTYAEIREEVFHPNCDAIVEAIGED